MDGYTVKRRRAQSIELFSSANSNGDTNSNNNNSVGKLERLKQREAELAAQLAAVRREKLSALRARPLTIGIVGFGRFGQFIAKTFAKYGRIVVTSRTDYTDIAESIGVKYIPLSDPDAFFAEGLDVIVIAVSILSFESTINMLVPYIQKAVNQQRDLSNADDNFTSSPLHGPLIVDVLSVKEHARNVMLERLPLECDILCTHPMFGPDSGKNGWAGLNFVYEKTRINKVLIDPKSKDAAFQEAFVDQSGRVHSVHEDNEAHAEAMDRMERFLSIWEEEGCRMVPLSCSDHDAYAANSQFITHLVGRVLGFQGLSKTPIDTSGFQSVLKLIDSTNADSFDLFYGLYKYNQNSLETITQLQAAMQDVVRNLQIKEDEELKKKSNKDENMSGSNPPASATPS
jgi:prephenate dehydrogenase